MDVGVWRKKCTVIRDTRLHASDFTRISKVLTDKIDRRPVDHSMQLGFLKAAFGLRPLTLEAV